MKNRWLQGLNKTIYGAKGVAGADGLRVIVGFRGRRRGLSSHSFGPSSIVFRGTRGAFALGERLGLGHTHTILSPIFF
jgi:hypothetical protein